MTVLVLWLPLLHSSFTTVEVKKEQKISAAALTLCEVIHQLHVPTQTRQRFSQQVAQCYIHCTVLLSSRDYTQIRESAAIKAPGSWTLELSFIAGAPRSVCKPDESARGFSIRRVNFFSEFQFGFNTNTLCTTIMLQYRKKNNGPACFQYINCELANT